jgi:uncharacterized protein (TIGR00730 family)
MMRRVCVFCGSSNGAHPGYLEAARVLGATLAGRGIGLVYGGARVGLMGAIADAVLEHGGEGVGVIPEALVAREVAHTGLTQLHVVKSMHERKARMSELSDAFIALPGGFGTLEEFAEILTWAQLGLHHKPFGLLNVQGYYTPLLTFFDHAVHEGFVPPVHRALVLAEEDPGRLLDLLTRYDPPRTEKWIDRDET